MAWSTGSNLNIEETLQKLTGSLKTGNEKQDALLSELLSELKIMNRHNEIITNIDFTEE